MSLEKNKGIIRGLVEAVSKRNLAIANKFAEPDYVDHNTPIQGLEGANQFYAMLFKGFPDFHRTIEDIIAEGDKVWLRFKITMTHTGEFRGLAPTGKKITASTVNIYRIVNGKIVETWSVNDFSDFNK